MFEHYKRLFRRALGLHDPLKFDSYEPNADRHASVRSSDVWVGRFSYGHTGITLREHGEGAALRIGSFCSIAAGLTVFLGGNHRPDWVSTFPFGHIYQDKLKTPRFPGHPASKGDVIIGNDVWIGQGVTITSGIRIADGAVVAATSTVTKDIGPYEIWGGNPAKFIRKRFDDEVIDALLELRWWDLPVETIERLAPLLSAAPMPEAISTMREIAEQARGARE